MTRGLAEITRLGVTLGANPLTFLGLAGMGDLVLTCTGDLSRNRRVGLELGRGRKLAEIVAGMQRGRRGRAHDPRRLRARRAHRRRDADRRRGRARVLDGEVAPKRRGVELLMTPPAPQRERVENGSH